MRSAHLKMVLGICLSVFLAGAFYPANSQNRETGYAVKKPIFGGGNAVQPASGSKDPKQPNGPISAPPELSS